MTKTLNMLLFASAATALTMAYSAASAKDEAANPFAMSTTAIDQTPAVAITPQMSETLRPFPAGKEDLFLSGERTSRNIAFYVTDTETALPAQLVLELETAVSAMPERSSLDVFVNDQQFASNRLGIGKDTRIVADLPAGTFQPGFNAIKVVANHRHRVDCSIPATYELWTQIDTSRSGVDFGSRSATIEQLADLPALARNGQQRTPINLVLPQDAPDALVEQGLRAAQAIAILGRLSNPSVQITNGSQDRPGITVVMGSGSRPATSQTHILAPGISGFSSTAGSGLVVGDATGAGIAAAVDTLTKAALETVPYGSKAGLKALDEIGGHSALTDRSERMVDLGLDTVEFAGRHYQSGFQFALPSDFYAADYAAARLTIDAAYAAGLSSDAKLVVRANGKQVTSLSLSSATRGELDGQDLDINLGMLKPGLNTINLEAFLPHKTDQTCELTTLNDDTTRFVIRPTSTIELPAVARIGHLPDLAMLSNATMLGESSEQPAQLDILTGERNAAELAAVGSILVRMAVTSSTVFQPELIDDMPAEPERALIAVGSFGDLPDELLTNVGIMSDSIPTGEQSSAGAEADPNSISTSDYRSASFAASFSEPIEVYAQLQKAGNAVKDTAERVLGGFASLPGLSKVIAPEGFVSARDLSRSADEALVVAQAATPTARPYPWTVFAAKDSDALSSGVQEMTHSKNWVRLEGAAGSLSTGNRLDLHSTTAERLYETQPRSYGNLRLVFAGWLSRHLYEYVAILLILALALGLSTRLFLKNLGAKA
ncbi:cellulose biosynthesis cyclic di-GMP-binding regulatory protein BcsB [Fulvimarina sp. MAC3]|uniref:cellulose biosynthesis cyclic di-GMP-binding regulatory protein BcsB n=1 Tax=Fulvimarina sp. MAC3 TaxID=3148887 RepID=UPI0031FC5FC9